MMGFSRNYLNVTRGIAHVQSVSPRVAYNQSVDLELLLESDSQICLTKAQFVAFIIS